MGNRPLGIQTWKRAISIPRAMTATGNARRSRRRGASTSSDTPILSCCRRAVDAVIRNPMQPARHGQLAACTGCHLEAHGVWHCRATRARTPDFGRGEAAWVPARVSASAAMAAASRAKLAGLRMKCVQYRTPSTKGSGATESMTMGRSRCTGCVRICRRTVRRQSRAFQGRSPRTGWVRSSERP